MFEIIEDTQKAMEVVVNAIKSPSECNLWAGKSFDFFDLKNDYKRYLENKKDEKCLVYYSNRTGLSVAQLVLGEITRTGSATVKYVAVRKEYRKCNIGKEFLFYACKYAFYTLHLKVLRLRVFEENIAARKCYQHVGFLEVDNKMQNNSIRMFLTKNRFKEKCKEIEEITSFILMSESVNFAKRRVYYGNKLLNNYSFSCLKKENNYFDNILACILTCLKKINKDTLFEFILDENKFSCGIFKNDNKRKIKKRIRTMICKDHYFTEGYFSNIIKVTIHNSSDVIIIETNNTLINDKNDNDNSQKMIKYSLIIEEAMKEILEKKDINEKSDFFLEGGNSILAMKLVLQLEEAGLQIELEDIYNLRTPIKISKRVSKNS